jgi:cobalamin-dependent methionine synthase I
MIIIGELINASRKAIKAAIEAQDAESIQKVAKEQADAGADYIDVNAGIFVGKEPEYLKWLVETVQQATDKPCAIDSPDPAAIEMALSMHQGTPMINSISLEKERYEKLMPIVANTDMKVIALCMSDAGMPQTVEDRMKIADELVGGLLKNNVKVENIFVQAEWSHISWSTLPHKMVDGYGRFLLGLNVTAFPLILIFSPVWGFRPIRVFR